MEPQTGRPALALTDRDPRKRFLLHVHFETRAVGLPSVSPLRVFLLVQEQNVRRRQESEVLLASHDAVHVLKRGFQKKKKQGSEREQNDAK